MAAGKASKKRAPKGAIHAVKAANRWIGQPVCVVLNDGSCYVGTVQGIHGRKLILSEPRDCGKVNFSNRSKAPEVQVAGLLDSLIGGIGALQSFGSMATGLFKPMSLGPFPANYTDSASSGEPFGPSSPTGGQPGAGFGGGLFGSFHEMLPKFKIGLQMVKTIMPLIGAFKI